MNPYIHQSLIIEAAIKAFHGDDQTLLSPETIRKKLGKTKIGEAEYQKSWEKYEHFVKITGYR